jgi:hypothetical protein
VVEAMQRQVGQGRGPWQRGSGLARAPAATSEAPDRAAARARVSVERGDPAAGDVGKLELRAPRVGRCWRRSPASRAATRSGPD